MMNIQTASLEVPGGCPNRCKFCVSELNKKSAAPLYKNAFEFDREQGLPDLGPGCVPAFDFGLKDPSVTNQFLDRLLYLRQKHVDTLVFTGAHSEAINNENYLRLFNYLNRNCLKNDRFTNIECQTSGIGLTDEKLHLLEDVGVKTISLSLASLHDGLNAQIERTPEKMKVNISDTCRRIKEFGFNLRLSLNLSREGYDEFIDDELYGIHNLVVSVAFLKADQVTFKKLYFTKDESEINAWIKANLPPENWWKLLNEYVKKNGKFLNKTMWGASRYSLSGMSTVIDEDCMNKDAGDIRYIILYRNCRLYTAWDDPASLIF